MSIRKPQILSKSRFLAGLQCHLRLWYQCYNRDLATAISPVQQAIFDAGHQVGNLATRLYPVGILIAEDYLHHKKAMQSTLRAVEDSAVPAIFEAAFLWNGVRIRVDVLERLDNGGWNLVEVKSSTSVKDVHLPDVAVQYHVLRGSGVEVKGAYLMHVNNQYVYHGGTLDLKDFFSLSDLTDQVLSYQEETPPRLAELKDMLQRSNSPEIQPSRNCKNPYECEFWDYCTRNMPQHWVMELSGIGQGKLNELAAMKVRDISEIPESVPLSPMQERIRRCVMRGEEYISEKLQEELLDVAYPVHFLDFETIGSAIPRYPGTRPYQTIPFQWSDHILHKDGSLDHREYLCYEDKDPREDFARTLLEALGSEGSIFIYTTYEEGIIRELADYLPHSRSELMGLLVRLKDLHAMIRTSYYHPGFHGSFSLKAVLPALVPDMTYGNLEIQEGQLAGLEYLKMIDPSLSTDKKEKIGKNLLAYCGQDTLAMVKLREELLKKFG